MSIALELWRFWFERLDREARFRSDPEVDAALRDRFATLPDRALNGDLVQWRETPRENVALLLVLDQLPRNLYRGEAQAFAYDGQALAEARDALARGVDAEVSVEERFFLYLPFEHSENLADQDRACALFEALGDPEGIDYALRHRDVIREFGRFPHRNKALGRVSSEVELAYLATPGSGF